MNLNLKKGRPKMTIDDKYAVLKDWLEDKQQDQFEIQELIEKHTDCKGRSPKFLHIQFERVCKEIELLEDQITDIEDKGD